MEASLEDYEFIFRLEIALGFGLSVVPELDDNLLALLLQVFKSFMDGLVVPDHIE